MVGWRGIALAAAVVVGGAVGASDEASAQTRPKMTVRVEPPPGVKPSDVTVTLRGSGYGDDDSSKATLGEDNQATIEAARGDYTFVNVTAGGRTMTTIVYVPRSGPIPTVTIRATELADTDAYYDPEKVYEKGRQAAAAGDAAGAKAAADALDGAATAQQRYASDFRQAHLDVLRDTLSGLPPEFVNDFLRDLGAATTAEARQAVVRRYRNSATINAPDSVVSDEFRASRASFMRLVNADLRSTLGTDQERAAEQNRAWATDLRQLAEQSAAPPGQGSLPLSPGARPQLPGQGIPGVPAAPGGEYATVLRPNYWVQLGAGAAFFDAKPVGYGTLIVQPGVQGTEQYIAETGSRSTGYRLSLDGGWEVCEGGQLIGHAAYRRAYYEDDGFIPIGGPAVGVTYFDRAPNDSTGINLGATGANTTVKGDFAKYEADFTYRVDLNKKFNWADMGPRYNAGLGIGYRRFDLDYKARQTSPTFDDISSRAWIDSTTNIIGPRIEGGLSWNPQTFAPVRIEVQSYVIPGFRWGSGTAKQKSLCGACPADEQNLKIVREQSRSGFGLVAGITGRVAVDLTDELQLGVEGGYEFTNGVNTWHTPRGPFEAPANLAPEPVKVGYVGVNLRLNF